MFTKSKLAYFLLYVIKLCDLQTSLIQRIACETLAIITWLSLDPAALITEPGTAQNKRLFGHN